MAAALRVGVRRNGGFTLLELMIAVAVLGILAGILVLSFAKPQRKAKTRSEAQAMFTELHRAEAQYITENGRYLATESMFPTGATTTAVAVTSLPTEWDDLKIINYPNALYCSYIVYAGGPDDGIPAVAFEFGMEQPSRSWYVLYAECDIDGDSSVLTRYFSSSVDATLQSENEGK